MIPERYSRSTDDTYLPAAVSTVHSSCLGVNTMIRIIMGEDKSPPATRKDGR